MSTLIIEKATVKKQLDNGATVYSVIGKVDGELETVDLIAKNAPTTGETMEGTVEDTQWGKKFKKQASGGFRGAYTPRPEDPERQASIIRQSSFERAILIQAGKAQIFTAEKKYDDAHKCLEFKTITDLSEYIAKYAEGKLSPNPNPKLPEKQEYGSEDGEQYFPDEP